MILLVQESEDITDISFPILVVGTNTLSDDFKGTNTLSDDKIVRRDPGEKTPGMTYYFNTSIPTDEVVILFDFEIQKRIFGLLHR